MLVSRHIELYLYTFSSQFIIKFGIPLYCLAVQPTVTAA
jgi:hypothetical protein